MVSCLRISTGSRFESIKVSRSSIETICGPVLSPVLAVGTTIAVMTLSISKQEAFSMESSQFAVQRDTITAGILSLEPEEMRMLGYPAAGQLKDWSPMAIDEEGLFLP